MTAPISKSEVYNSIDYDYPMCGGNKIEQVADKPIYLVTHESNVSGQRSGQVTQIELNIIVEVDDVVYTTSGGENCTMADCLIPTDIGVYGRNYINDIGVKIVSEIVTRRGHLIF